MMIQSEEACGTKKVSNQWRNKHRNIQLTINIVAMAALKNQAHGVADFKALASTMSLSPSLHQQSHLVPLP